MGFWFEKGLFSREENQNFELLSGSGAEGPWGPRVAVVLPTFCNFFLY